MITSAWLPISLFMINQAHTLLQALPGLCLIALVLSRILDGLKFRAKLISHVAIFIIQSRFVAGT
jgi:hypothetical protein